MKENFKNFIKQARANKLSEQEKDTLRYKILEFISFNPIRGKAPIVRDRNYISIFEVKYFMKAASLALICILVVGGSGVSYVAAKSLPGEALYTVKININENIEETLATTPKAKLAVQSEHIQRRLDEVQKLRKEQKLSPETQKIVVAKIGEHTALAAISMDALKESGDVTTVLETTAKLTPVLEANREILSDPEKNETLEGLPEDRTSLVAVVDDSIKVVQDQENAIIASVDTSDASPSTVMMSVVTEDPMKKTGPSEEELAAKKVATEVKAISRQISEIVQDRIDSAQDKLYAIETEVRAEENLKIEAEIKADKEETPSVETVLDTAISTAKEPTAVVSDISNKKELNSKLLPIDIIEKIPADAPSTAELTTKDTVIVVDTTEFEEIYAQIKSAENMLRQAKIRLQNKDFKDALTLAQEANKIAEDILAKRRIKNLELSKQTNNNTTLKANVETSLKTQ